LLPQKATKRTGFCKTLLPPPNAIITLKKLLNEDLATGIVGKILIKNLCVAPER
jgi:hypothetical protein